MNETKVTLETNGFWITTPLEKRLGPYARVEQVAEGSIYYRLYKQMGEDYFLLLNATNGRLIIYRQEDEFKRIDSYSQENKSFVAYPCVGNGCVLIGENADTSRQCLCVGEEIHNYRAIQMPSAKWVFVHSRTLKTLWNDGYEIKGGGLDKRFSDSEDGFFTKYYLDEDGNKQFMLCRYILPQGVNKGGYSHYSSKFSEVYELSYFIIGVSKGQYHIFSKKSEIGCSPLFVSDTKPQKTQQHILAHDDEGYALLRGDACYTHSLWKSAELTVIDGYVVNRTKDGLRLFALSKNRVRAIDLPIGWTIEEVVVPLISTRKEDGNLIQTTPRELEVQTIRLWDSLAARLAPRADTQKYADTTSTPSIEEPTAPSKPKRTNREVKLEKWRGMEMFFPQKIKFYTITSQLRTCFGQAYNIDTNRKTDGLNREDFICWIAIEDRLFVIAEYCGLKTYLIRYYQELTEENIKGLDECHKFKELPEFQYDEASLFTEFKRNVFHNLTHQESDAYLKSIFRERLNSFLTEQLKGTDCEISLKIDCTQKGGLKVAVQERKVPTPRQKKAAPTTLRITFPDDTVICGPIAADVLKDLVMQVGVEEVAALPIETNRQLMGREPREKAGEQRELTGGWYLYTKSSTTDKAEQARKISDLLNLGLKIEVIARTEATSK